jgi:hypothetical protein
VRLLTPPPILFGSNFLPLTRADADRASDDIVRAAQDRPPAAKKNCGFYGRNRENLKVAGSTSHFPRPRGRAAPNAWV